MSKRLRLILIVLAAAVIIAAVVFLIWSSGGQKQSREVGTAPAPSPETPAVSLPEAVPPSSPGTVVNVNAAPEVPVAPAPVPASAALTRQAASFAERYGSYSNQGNFANLRDLFPLMTSRMKSATERTISEASKSGTGQAEYFGVTTRTVATSVVELDSSGGTAIILVSTQRSTARGAAAPVISYQDVELQMLKVNGEWKFDRATWK